MHQGYFLLNYAINFYLFLLILRLALYDRELFFNPLIRWIFPATEFIISPLRNITRPLARFRHLPPLFAMVLVLLCKILLLAGLFSIPLYSSIISTIDDLLNFLLLLFILLTIFRLLLGEFSYNFLARIVYQLTSPLFVIFKIGKKRQIGAGLMTIFLLILAHSLLNFLILSSSSQSLPSFSSIYQTFKSSLKYSLRVMDIFVFLIIASAILSWTNPDPSNPIISFLHSLIEPLLRPMRKVIPPLGSLDITPIFLILFISLAKRVMFFLINYF